MAQDEMTTQAEPRSINSATSSDNGHMYLSDVSTISGNVHRVPTKYATLEQNLWRCDGTWKFAPANEAEDMAKAQYAGYISDALSGADGRFATPPVITLQYSMTHIPIMLGVVVMWGDAVGEWAEEFTVTAYNGDAVAKSETVTGNTEMTYTVSMDIAEYDRITVAINKWSQPYQRARVERVLARAKMYTARLPEWEEIQRRQLVNESYIQISFTVDDPEATADATSSDNGHIYLSDVGAIASNVQQIPAKYATLEQNLWRCDGTWKFAPANEAQDMAKAQYAGYISDALSGADGYFATPPVITLQFGEVHAPALPGVTVTWSDTLGEYAEEFTVTAYNGEEVIARKEVTGNTSTVSAAWVDIAGYDRITVAVNKWSRPFGHARAEKLMAGVNMLYRKGDITGYSHEMSCDPICATLPTDVVNFSLDNTRQVYDPNNPTGMSQYLMERQELDVHYGLKMDDGVIEWIPAGVFFLSEWDAPQNGIEANFTARDITELLQGTYIKGVYAPEGRTLYALAQEVLTDAELSVGSDGNPRWVIDDALMDITTPAPLPVMTRAECLQLIAQAGCCTMWHDRAGRLYIGRQGAEESGYTLDDFILYKRPEISLQTPLGAVAVDVNEYFADTAGQQLYEGRADINGTQEITVNYFTQAVDAQASVSGGTLVAAVYYAQACRLTITATGTVNITITGTTLKSSSYSYSLAASDKGEVQSVSNPLICDSARAHAVAQWVSEYLSMRRQLTMQDWRGDPRLDAGDMVTVDNRFGSERARMTRLKYTYTGAFHGSGEARALESGG